MRRTDLKMPAVGFALLCGSVSVVHGLLSLSAAGAPRRYLLINAGALALGLTYAAVRRFLGARDRVVGSATLAIGLCLLATAAFGVPVHGAARWIRVAGVSLQPSLILLPFALVHFARRPGALSSFGLALAGIALAWQPDRAMAGVLVAGLGAIWTVRRETPVALAWVTAAAGFGATWLRADTVPPAPYVERVLQSSFATHPLVGLAVFAGLAVMLFPAVAGVSTRGADRLAFLVFGVTWLAIEVAAFLGNYPTPLVGYGSSAILGYCLSATTLDGQASDVGRHDPSLTEDARDLN